MRSSMDPFPTLSFLVPTYGRAARLERLLRTLAADPVVSGRRVPVLVADNASPDGTAAMVRRLQEELAGTLDLRLHVHGENVGAVANLAWLAANAPETDYVWPMGDDDAPADGAVAKVLGLLADHEPAVLHLPHRWERDGRVTRASPVPGAYQAFPSGRELFNACTEWLTFLSATVVRRDALARAARDAPTANPWAPFIWYALCGRDGACGVPPECLVVGSGDEPSWSDRMKEYLSIRAVEAFDEGMHLVVDTDEYGVNLDTWYDGKGHVWSAQDPETVVAVAVRFSSSRELRRIAFDAARRHGRHDLLIALDDGLRAAGAGEAAARLVAGGEERFGASDLHGAVAAFAAAIRELPTSAEAWNNIGVVRHEVSDPRALEAFDAALAIDPDYVEALLNRARLRLEAGLRATAYVDAVRAAELSTGDPAAGDLVSAASA